MKDGAMLTRDECRERFAGLGLGYGGHVPEGGTRLGPEDVRELRTWLIVECAAFREEHEGHDGTCDCACPRMARQMEIEADRGRSFRSAFLFCDGPYFTGREAVSFNSDGSIGIAGWASDNNVQPFLRGFMRWLDEIELYGIEGSGRS